MSKQSYRESFGLSLPESGTIVEIHYLPGCNYMIVWPDCPDLESCLYQWLKSKNDAIQIIKKNGWVCNNKIKK